MNKRAFERKEKELFRAKDLWLQVLGFLVLGHPILPDVDFGNFIDILTNL